MYDKWLSESNTIGLSVGFSRWLQRNIDSYFIVISCMQCTGKHNQLTAFYVPEAVGHHWNKLLTILSTSRKIMSSGNRMQLTKEKSACLVIIQLINEHFWFYLISKALCLFSSMLSFLLETQWNSANMVTQWISSAQSGLMELHRDNKKQNNLLYCIR